MRDGFPHCIKTIVQREATAQAAVDRIRLVFPFWSPRDIHRGASVDKQKTTDQKYIDQLDDLLKYTEAAP